MVTLEFHKPSTWSKGQKIGILGLVLIVIGPFLPYVVFETNFGGTIITNSYAYFNFAIWGFFIFIPFLSAFIIAMALYLKYDILLQNESTQVNIKPLIIMSLSFWFFLTYVSDVFRYFHPGNILSTYPGIGLIMIVLGFLLCFLAGFFEWRASKRAGLGVGSVSPLMGPQEKPAVQPTPSPISAAPIQNAPQQNIPKTPLNAKPIKVVDQGHEPTPSGAPITSEEVKIPDREMTAEEQKHLLRWVSHITKDGMTFERCLKCQNYVFMRATKTPDAYVFTCPECAEIFLYKK
jgi:hypothetical protein